MRSGRFLGQKGPKRAQNDVRQVLWKIDAWNFSDFLHEITANKVLILSGFFFREKVSFWVFWVKLDQKRPKISSFKLYKKIIHDFWGNSVLKVPKMKFYKFYVKSLYQTFLIFCIKTEERLELVHIFFVLGFLGKKGPKMNILSLKVGLSPSKKNRFICFNESPLKMMKNALYFILKALFALKIFKFLCWPVGHLEKTASLES